MGRAYSCSPDQSDVRKVLPGDSTPSRNDEPYHHIKYVSSIWGEKSGPWLLSSRCKRSKQLHIWTLVTWKTFPFNPEVTVIQVVRQRTVRGEGGRKQRGRRREARSGRKGTVRRSRKALELSLELKVSVTFFCVTRNKSCHFPKQYQIFSQGKNSRWLTQILCVRDTRRPSAASFGEFEAP